MTIFGGVAAMKTEHFRLVNGFSNKFFGWGGEDDDLYNRLILVYAINDSSSNQFRLYKTYNNI